MILYFQSGKKRLALDTERKAYTTDYCWLGGWKSYIRVNDIGIREITAQCVRDGYTPNFEEVSR
jgi:hypothetical protein